MVFFGTQTTCAPYKDCSCAAPSRCAAPSNAFSDTYIAAKNAELDKLQADVTQLRQKMNGISAAASGMVTDAMQLASQSSASSQNVVSTNVALPFAVKRS